MANRDYMREAAERAKVDPDLMTAIDPHDFLDLLDQMEAATQEVERLRSAVGRLRKCFAIQLATSDGAIYCEHNGCLASIDWPLIADSAWDVDGHGWWFCPVHAADAIRHAAGVEEEG